MKVNMEKINIAELLKNCPTGMELDCALFDNVILSRIDSDSDCDYPIRIETKGGCLMDLTKYGTYTNEEEAKCLIFPKGKNTWEGFVPCKFKDGDIVATEIGSIFIYNKSLNSQDYFGCYVGLSCMSRQSEIIIADEFVAKTSNLHLATEEEQKKLFEAIKANGYRWYAKTKKLIKLEFIVGDRIRAKKGAPINISNIIITAVSEWGYNGVIGDTTNLAYINFKDQDLYELDPTKFNVNTLKPFNEMLMSEDNKINIVELLKKCPKGMELDCTMYENLEFDHIDEESIYPIKCRAKITDVSSNSHEFTKNGQPNHYPHAKCVIFPKGKTSWEGFIPLKEGDVVISTYGDIHLLRTEDSSHCSYRHRRKNKLDSTITTGITVDRLATEEEKQLLFDTIKDNGYKWNEVTKTLEKPPKFKVGDRIKHKDSDIYCTLGEYSEGISAYRTNIGLSLTYKDLEQWELAPNKFDVNTLKPFDQVLVREDNKKLWRIHFFERLNNILKDPFVCMGGYRYHQCVPYVGNEYLLNTSNEPDNFYITW